MHIHCLLYLAFKGPRFCPKYARKVKFWSLMFIDFNRHIYCQSARHLTVSLCLGIICWVKTSCQRTSGNVCQVKIANEQYWLTLVSVYVFEWQCKSIISFIVCSIKFVFFNFPILLWNYCGFLLLNLCLVTFTFMGGCESTLNLVKIVGPTCHRFGTDFDFHCGCDTPASYTYLFFPNSPPGPYLHGHIAYPFLHCFVQQYISLCINLEKEITPTKHTISYI